MTTTKPVLQPDTLYLAHDRFVCARTACAGSAALHTGVTISGAPVTKVTEADRIAWESYGLGPATCECGAVTLA